VNYNELLLAQIQQTAACNALHATESRLARWLLQTRDRIDSDVLPLTQEFLSQMLGVRRTTVNLVARQLEQAGVIKNRRGRIVVLDRKGLEDVACECYASSKCQAVKTPPFMTPPLNSPSILISFEKMKFRRGHFRAKPDPLPARRLT
jgi:biotin operon repressor